MFSTFIDCFRPNMFLFYLLYVGKHFALKIWQRLFTTFSLNLGTDFSGNFQFSSPFWIFAGKTFSSREISIFSVFNNSSVELWRLQWIKFDVMHENSLNLAPTIHIFQ